MGTLRGQSRPNGSIDGTSAVRPKATEKTDIAYDRAAIP
jgi:hypothetical protein